MAATLFSFVYGLRRFFKKGKPLLLQTLTMAMGCHSLGSIYHMCRTVTNDALVEGFTPAYLGHIGFFLFILTASYGQLDRIVDDGSKENRPARLIALIAPVCAAHLFIPNAVLEDVTAATKVSYALVWIPAIFGVYFNLKHAIIPNLDFGFIKALKLYNILAVCLSFSELLCLTAWDYYDAVAMAVSSVIFGVLCVCTVFAGKRGVEKWTV